MSELVLDQPQTGLSPERIEHLEAMQGYLTGHAHQALGAYSFDERNREMAATVADEAAILAGDSLRQSGATPASTELRQAFYFAGLEAGDAFAGAFNADGTPLEDNKAAVKAGQKAAGAATLRYLPEALKASGVGIENAQALLNTMTFQDVVRLTADQLRVPMPEDLSAEHVVRSLKGDDVQPGTVATGDYFYDQIDHLPLSEAAPLTLEAEQALDVAVRLFNATWKVGQVHVAANEGKDDRINPDKREAFNPYDLLKDRQYARVLAEGRSADDAVLRVAFEVWKDVAQGQQTASQNDVAVARGYRVGGEDMNTLRVAAEDRLVPADFDATHTNVGNAKSRTEKGRGYPNRIQVADGTTWQALDHDSYHPQDFTAYDQDTPPVWADPRDPRESKNAPGFESYTGPIMIDGRGRPLNPLGPTGLEGRGELGNWGRNAAADPIVTRVIDGRLELIVITRKDTGEPAFPGGMVDAGERATVTLRRELGEETSAELDFDGATPVYQGYVDDPRNTDNAWMETDAYHLHLPEGTETRLDSSNDPDGGTMNARWAVVDEGLLDSLYASHSDMARRAIAQWQDANGVVVDKNGRVGVAA